MLRSWAIFSGPLRTAIHSLKYQRNIPLGIELADQLRIVYEKEKWAVDLVVPVPLSKKRKKERGFNQAKILAYPLAKKVGVPFDTECIKRIKETRSQVGLTIKERKFNVANAFSTDQIFVKSKRILLVDDVATTGATLNECAISLLQAGAKEVYALTLARAAGQNDN